MNLFSLVATLGLDTSQYEKGLDQSKSKAAAFGGALKSGLTTAGKFAAGAVTAVAGAATAAGVAIVKSTGNVAQYGDNIDKMSQKMGISSKAYQEWDAIMRHSGTTIDALKPSMKTLATQAEKNSDAFQKLGISQEEVASLSQEDLFARVIAGLQGMEEGTERTALTSQLLGRGATELGALLNTSAEDTQKMRDRVHELNGVMSEEAVKASAKYQDTLQDMTTAFEGVKRNAISEFLPGVTMVMDGLTNIFAGEKGGVKKITEGVTSIVKKVGEVAPKFVNVVSSIAQSLGKAILDNLPTITKFVVDGALSVSSAMISNAPVIMNAIITILSTIWDSIKNSTPQLLNTAMGVILQLSTFLSENLGSIIEAGMNLLNSLLQGIMNALPKLIEYLPTIIGNIYTALLQAYPKILEGGMKLLMTLLEGILNVAPKLIEAFPKIISEILKAFLSVDWVGLGRKIITFIGNGVKLLLTHIPQLLLSIGKATVAIVTSINWLELGKTIIITLGKGVIALATVVPKALLDIGKSAVKSFASVDWAKVGKDVINGIKNGIVRFAGNIATAAVNAAKDAIEAVKNWLGIASPSKRAEKEIGKWMALGVGSGWDKYMPVNDMQDTMQDTFDSLVPDIDNSVSDDVYTVSTEGSDVRPKSTFSPTINVYGAEGQDVEQLADIVIEKLTFAYQRQGSVFA